MREYNRYRYYLVLILSIFIFTIGLLLGIVVENKRVILIQHETIENEIIFESLKTNYMMMNQQKDFDCKSFDKNFENSIRQLEDIRIKIEEYRLSAKINENEYNRLDHRLFILKMNHYLLLEEVKDKCDLGFIVLYFFSDQKECPRCSDQEFVLTYFRKTLDTKFRVFAINSNIDDYSIKLLKEKYDVKSYPTVIISEDKFEGLMSREIIKNYICKEDKESCELIN